MVTSANDTWNYAGTANWTTAADWSLGVPAATSNVVVAKGAPTVTGAIGIASLTNSAQVAFANAGSSTISGALSNAGKVILDGASGQGGSKLTIGGALSNTGIVQIGAADGSLSASDTLQATSLVNTGRVLLYGGAASSKAAQLTVTGAAGFGAAGVLTGGVALSGNAAITFASGSIAKIASKASLTLTGASAVIADSGASGANSALSGLTMNLGALMLVNGAQVATSGALTSVGALSLDSDGQSSSSLTIGGVLTTQGSPGPSLAVDAAQGEGGSTLTINGALKYSGIVELGNRALSQSSTVATTGLVALKGAVSTMLPGLPSTNYGSLSLSSDVTTAAQMLLQVSSAAGFGTAGVLAGNVSLSGDSAIVFASGQISTIAANGGLSLDGPLAVIADASAQSSNSALTGLTRVAGTLSLGDGASFATSGALSITGTADIDSGYFYNYNDTNFHYDQGGSSLTVGGALTVSGAPSTGSSTGVLSIGDAAMTDNATVIASSLVNQGQITVAGDLLAGAGGLLDIASGAGFGSLHVLSGAVTVSSGGTIEFAWGSLWTIAAGATLTLDGASAFVANAAALTSNSALAALSTIAGTLALDDGANFSPSVALTISGSVNLDYVGPNTYNSNTYAGGSSLTVAGLLTNAGALDIGSSTMAATDTVTVKSLVNSGTINIVGGASASAEALLNDTGAAGFGTAGVLSGAVTISGAGVVEFASGQIASIASGASLTLDGSQAFVADAGHLTSNSALLGLSSIAGTLALDDGAAFSTSGAVALLSSGAFDLDYVGPYTYNSSYSGGSSLAVNGVLSNAGSLNIGSSAMTQTDTVTVKGLVNTGTINLAGGASASAEALLNDTGAAGFGTAGVLSGIVRISGAAVVEFAAGQISSIARGASLMLSGSKAFVADAAAPNSNSALTGLTGVAGSLGLNDGESITTTGALSNTGTLALDGPYLQGQTFLGVGGSSLTVNGALTNSGSITIGSSSMLNAATLTTTNLTNNGMLDLYGHALLFGPLANNGSVIIDQTGNIVKDSVTGSGGFSLNNYSSTSLEFDSSVGANARVSFSNYGSASESLILGAKAATAFGGTISGFSFPDSIDLVGLGTGTTASFAANSYNSGGTLTLSNGSHVANIAFQGQYATSSFSLTSTATDTLVTFV